MILSPKTLAFTPLNQCWTYLEDHVLVCLSPSIRRKVTVHESVTVSEVSTVVTYANALPAWIDVPCSHSEF